MRDSDPEAAWRGLGRALARGDTGHAGQAYPSLEGMHPVFLAVEQAGARWRLLPGEAPPTPQQARDELAHQFLVRASRTAGHEQASYRDAAALLDRERHDHISAAGRQFRIVRAGQAARTGPGGPEPPRATDTPHPRRPRPGHPFLEDPDAERDIASATLKAALREWQSKAGTLPPELIADERRARTAYPDVILLGPWFAIAELTGGRWQSLLIHEDDTPAAARTSLTTYLRQTAPAREKPGGRICAAYAKAAEELESGQLNDITAAGRRFRISRVERYVRAGPSGPEPPRTSDYDPYPPPAE